MATFLPAFSRGEPVLRDIQFSRPDGTPLLLDASIPEGPGPFPAAILVHGGAWVGGDKSYGFQPVEKPLREAGIAWFSVNYRLAPRYLYPSAVEDVAAAVRYVRTQAAEYRIDPERIVLIGESAGAHLAQLVALQNEPRSRVRAVVSFYGPTDLVGLAHSSPLISDEVRRQVRSSAWGPLIEGMLNEFSPINKVRAGMPPVLFIHGTADPVVPFTDSSAMCARMKALGNTCEVLPVDGGRHGMLHWRDTSGYVPRMLEFLRIQLKS